MLDVNHANIAALAEKGSMLAIAKAMSGHWGVNIIPSGTDCSTDGDNIYFPYNADHLKDATRQILHGLLDHEVTHVAEERAHVVAGKTTPLTLVRNAIRTVTEKMMFNVFEDIRVETKYSAMYPGVAQNLNAANLNSVDLFQKRHGKDNINNGHFWHTLGCAIIMKARGYSTSWVPSNVVPFLDMCEDEVKESTKDGLWGEDALALARRVIKKIEKLAQQVEQEQKQRKEQQKGQEKQQGQDGKGQSQQSGQDGQQKGDEGKANENAQDGNGQSQSNQEGKDKQSGKKSPQSGSEGDKKEQTKAQGDKDGKGESKAAQMTDKQLKEAADAAKASKQQAQYDDLMQAAKDHITDMAEADARDNRRYLPNRRIQMEDKFVQIPSHANDHEMYMLSRDKVSDQIRGMKAKLLNVIRTRANAVTLRNQRKGKLSFRNPYKIATDAETIYTRTMQGEKLDTAVSILVDMSGSMGDSGNAGNKAYYARLAAIALGETLDALRIPFEITGFNTGGGGLYSGDRGDGNVRTSPMRYYSFKAFDDKFKRTRTRLNHITGSGCNVDGEALLMAASRLVKRPEARKIQIVISDGLPRGGGCSSAVLERHLGDTIRLVASKGVEIIGIGVKAPKVGNFYNKRNGAECILIDDLSQMAVKIYKVMKDALLKGKNRRAA